MTSPVVLVVDDDEAVRSLVRATLVPRDLDVVEASDGASALERAEERAPSLVVLDWRMPGPTGFEVLTELSKRHPGARVILVSAELRNSHGGLAQVFGADAFLEKPFSPQRLLDLVDALLGDGELDEAS